MIYNAEESKICLDCVQYMELCERLGIVTLSSSKNLGDCEAEVSENTSSPGNNQDTMNESNTCIDINEMKQQFTNLQSIITSLKRSVKVLHSAYVGSRVELRFAFQESSLHERRIIEQQIEIESLQAKLSKLSLELQTLTSNSFDSKKAFIEANTSMERFKIHNIKLQMQVKEKDERIKKLVEEVSRLKDSITSSTVSKRDLAEIYSQHIK